MLLLLRFLVRIFEGIWDVNVERPTSLLSRKPTELNNFLFDLLKFVTVANIFF